MTRRFALAAGLLVLAFPARGDAQVTFNYDFETGTGRTGSVGNPAYYTTDRRNAIVRAGDHVRTQLDARGTVNIQFGTLTGAQIGSSAVAIGGSYFFFIEGGGFSNGITYLQATTGDIGTSFHSAIDFNSDYTNWFSGSGTSAGSGQADMQSVALHEITHGLGFTSLINNTNGLGIGGTNTYSRQDDLLRLGTAPDAPRLITTAAQFNSAGGVAIADLSGDNIYFHGEMAMAANGGSPVRLAGGGDRSHLHASAANAVMLPGIGGETDRRAYTPIDLGMLIDNGWNQFVWTETTGGWAENVSSLANPRWGNVEGFGVLSPVGTITPNMVLRFGGAVGYTSTNDLDLTATGGRFLLTRLILSGAAGESTIAAAGANTLRFDSTIGVAPQVRQDGGGAFVISHPVELTGRNLQLAGNGSGRVTLSGVISTQTGQTGGLTKMGTSTFVLTGNNTYNGGTTIQGGSLFVNGQSGSNSGTGTGVVAVTGGRLGGTGRVGGAVSATGGQVAPGTDAATGVLTVGGVTFTSSATFAARLNGPTAGAGYDQLVVESGTVSLGGAALALTLGYTPELGHLLVILRNDGAGATTGQFAGFAPGAGVLVGGVPVHVFYDYDFGTGSFGGGNDVVVAFSPTPVPEPAFVFGLAAVILGAGRACRRTSRAVALLAVPTDCG